MKIYPIKNSPTPHIDLFLFCFIWTSISLSLQRTTYKYTYGAYISNPGWELSKKTLNLLIHFLLWYEVGVYLILFLWLSMKNFIWFGGEALIKYSSLQPVSHLFLSLSHTLSFTFSFLYKIKFSLPISLGLYLYFVVRT